MQCMFTRKRLFFCLQFGKEQNILGLKEELTDLFKKLPGYFLFPHKVYRGWRTIC